MCGNYSLSPCPFRPRSDKGLPASTLLSILQHVLLISLNTELGSVHSPLLNTSQLPYLSILSITAWILSVMSEYYCFSFIDEKIVAQKQHAGPMLSI